MQDGTEAGSTKKVEALIAAHKEGVGRGLSGHDGVSLKRRALWFEKGVEKGRARCPMQERRKKEVGVNGGSSSERLAWGESGPRVDRGIS